MSKLLQRAKELEEVRRDYETGMWDDICRFVNPRREDIQSYDYTRTKGRKRGTNSYNGTPLSALNTWADGMQGFLISESLNWFRSEMNIPELNDIDEIREWLQEYDRAMYGAFRRSNFYATLGLYMRDAGSIGTATLYTDEDIIGKRAVHTCIHPREVFIDENRFGEVDTVFRKFELTARQAYSMFKDKCSNAIIQNNEKKPSHKHLFWHAVFPNDDKWIQKRGNKKYRSIYFMAEDNKDGKSTVKDSGYSVMPYSVWRFRKNSDEVYGYSPAADALVEVFSLNQISKDLLEAGHLSVKPALNIPEEMRGNVRITPNGYNYYSGDKGISPVHTGINFPIGIDREERLQKSIEDKYRVEFFLTLARAEREMTAYEIMERQSEKAVLMGPQVDQLYREGIRPIFDIVHGIEDRAGRLPEPPDILREYEYLLEEPINVNINLTGPLSQSQKRLFKMQPIKNAVNELAPMAQLFPEVLDRINADEMAEEILESANFPQKLIRSDEEVAQLRQQRAEQTQQQQMMQQAQAMAEAVPKLSKPIEAGSPLEMLSA